MGTSKQSRQSGRKRQTYNASFKQEAVSLGKRIGIVQAAADLGVVESNLRNWTREVDRLGSQAFLPASERTDLEAENRRLREENRVLKQEREILKKAAAFFAKDGA